MKEKDYTNGSYFAKLYKIVSIVYIFGNYENATLVTYLVRLPLFFSMSYKF